MGRIEAICVSVRKGEKKTPQPSAWFVAGHGIDADAHAGPWHRQVSLLAAEDIERMRQRGLDLKPGDCAENLVISGVNLGALGLGSRLRIGAHTDLNVTQIGKVCHQRCAIYSLLNGAFILEVPGSEHRAAAALLSSLPALRALQTRGTTAA